MARGAVRGAMAAWLGLVALQTLTSGDSSGKVGGAFDWVASVFQRALDPSIPAIPDHSNKSGANSTTPSPALGGLTPQQLSTAAANAGTLAQSGPAIGQAVQNATAGVGDQGAALGQAVSQIPPDVWQQILQRANAQAAQGGN